MMKDNAARLANRNKFDDNLSARARVERLLCSNARLGLFLDIDGTLLDVALTPSTVRVPPSLPEILGRLASRLDGALAIVTGRPISQADELLQPVKLIAAGVHGAELRTSASGWIEALSPSFSPALMKDIQDIALSMPGVVTEDKGTGIALHYRLAPEFQDALQVTLAALISKHPDQFSICEGRKVLEVLPIGFSKGRALRKLVTLPEFAGRIPIMIGDDVADVEAFRAAEDLGGYGLKVAGEHFTLAESSFIGPAEVLSWLEAALALLPCKSLR